MHPHVRHCNGASLTTRSSPNCDYSNSNSTFHVTSMILHETLISGSRLIWHQEPSRVTRRDRGVQHGRGYHGFKLDSHTQVQVQLIAIILTKPRHSKIQIWATFLTHTAPIKESLWQFTISNRLVYHHDPNHITHDRVIQHKRGHPRCNLDAPSSGACPSS